MQSSSRRRPRELARGDRDPVIPLLLFVILFGLSMDYHVFILSRIREAFHRGVGNDEALAERSTD